MVLRTVSLQTGNSDCCVAAEQVDGTTASVIGRGERTPVALAHHVLCRVCHILTLSILRYFVVAKGSWVVRITESVTHCSQQ